jgi:hypothetical protein
VILDLLLRLLRLRGLFGFQTLRLAPLHRLVMRMGLFVVLGARAAEEEENRLGVSRTHTASFRSWRAIVKRSTLPRGKI